MRARAFQQIFGFPQNFTRFASFKETQDDIHLSYQRPGDVTERL